jgi:large conductance mechanosensitive channel
MAAREAGAVMLNYGVFINTVINFVIVAFAVFILVKQINRLRRQFPQPPQTPKEKSCSYCRLNTAVDASRCPHCTSQRFR